ncbi:hypothetical protein CSAL01_01509 [Colletotrichum salicis]|uniref:Uncharacterized protein n=1 Tax=Colletotrichum salicis TaxID=1209931 RepID=A0A135V538_9PEZI|nr:hypothetical protein CSAL01_01509 [Colletotrichum salicis]
MRGSLETGGLWEQHNDRRRRPLISSASEIQSIVAEETRHLPQAVTAEARRQNVSAVNQDSQRPTQRNRDLGSIENQKSYRKISQGIRHRTPKAVKPEKTPDVDGLTRPLRPKTLELVSSFATPSINSTSRRYEHLVGEQHETRVRWNQHPMVAELLKLCALSIRPGPNCMDIGPLITQFDSSCQHSLLSKSVAQKLGLRTLPWRPGGPLDVMTEFGFFKPTEYVTGNIRASHFSNGDIGECNVALLEDEEMMSLGFQFLVGKKIFGKLVEKCRLSPEQRADIDLGVHRTSPKQSAAVPWAPSRVVDVTLNDRYMNRHLQPTMLDQASIFSTSYTASGNPSGFSANDAGPVSTARTSLDGPRPLRSSGSQMGNVNSCRSLCENGETPSHDGVSQIEPFNATSNNSSHISYGSDAGNSLDSTRKSLSFGNNTTSGAFTATNNMTHVESPTLPRNPFTMQMSSAWPQRLSVSDTEQVCCNETAMTSPSHYYNPDDLSSHTRSHQTQVARLPSPGHVEEMTAMTWDIAEYWTQPDDTLDSQSQPALVPAIHVNSTPLDNSGSPNHHVFWDPDLGMGVDLSFLSS